jgi:hypothetical protein
VIGSPAARRSAARSLSALSVAGREVRAALSSHSPRRSRPHSASRLIKTTRTSPTHRQIHGGKVGDKSRDSLTHKPHIWDISNGTNELAGAGPSQRLCWLCRESHTRQTRPKGTRMRYLKLIAAAVIALAAITTTAATAYGNQAEGFLPTTKFLGTSKVGTITTLAGKEIKCTRANVLSGSLETDSHGTLDIHFEECTAFGIFAANSLGDNTGVILEVVLLLLCLIEPKKLLFGIWIEPATPVHVEAAGILTTLQGGIIGTITPNANGLHKTITFKQKGGDPEPTTCTGTKGETKTANATLAEDKGKPESHGFAGEFNLEFSTAIELMDGS